jgi:hypothetical protein
LIESINKLDAFPTARTDGFEMQRRVRPLEAQDVGLIADYWGSLTPEDLDRMGVDKAKLPPHSGIVKLLEGLIAAGESASTRYLICLVDERPIGNALATDIKPQESAELHFHIWNRGDRSRGHGQAFLDLLIAEFSRLLGISRIIMQPSASNASALGLLATRFPELERRQIPAHGIVKAMEVVRFEWKRLP